MSTPAGITSQAGASSRSLHASAVAKNTAIASAPTAPTVALQERSRGTVVVLPDLGARGAS